MREDRSPVRKATKAGKERQCESNDQDKKEKRQGQVRRFNQYASQTDRYGSELDRESQSVLS